MKKYWRENKTKARRKKNEHGKKKECEGKLKGGSAAAGGTTTRSLGRVERQRSAATRNSNAHSTAAQRSDGRVLDDHWARNK